MVCDIGHSVIVYMDMFDILPLDVCVYECVWTSIFMRTVVSPRVYKDKGHFIGNHK